MSIDFSGVAGISQHQLQQLNSTSLTSQNPAIDDAATGISGSFSGDGSITTGLNGSGYVNLPDQGSAQFSGSGITASQHNGLTTYTFGNGGQVDLTTPDGNQLHFSGGSGMSMSIDNTGNVSVTFPSGGSIVPEGQSSVGLIPGSGASFGINGLGMTTSPGDYTTSDTGPNSVLFLANQQPQGWNTNLAGTDIANIAIAGGAGNAALPLQRFGVASYAQNAIVSGRMSASGSSLPYDVAWSSNANNSSATSGANGTSNTGGSGFSNSVTGPSTGSTVRSNAKSGFGSSGPSLNMDKLALKKEFEVITQDKSLASLLDSSGKFKFNAKVDSSFISPEQLAEIRTAVSENAELPFFREYFNSEEEAMQFLVHVANLESGRGHSLFNAHDAAGSGGGSEGFMHLHTTYGFKPESYGRALNTEGWTVDEALGDYTKYTTLVMRSFNNNYLESGSVGEAGIKNAMSMWWTGEQSLSAGNYYGSALSLGTGVDHSTGAGYA